MKHLLWVWSALLYVGSTGTAHAAESLVIVVPADSALEDIARFELRRAFLGQQVKDPSGQKLRPLNLPATSPNRVAFDEIILGMTADEAGRYWVLQEIRAAGSPPPSKPTQLAVAAVVAALPGAIAYLHQEVVPDDLKVVSVDGKRAGAEGYILTVEGLMAGDAP